MQVSQEVLTVLSAARVDGASLFLKDGLDRNLYVKTNKVLEAAGGKWNRGKKAHVFDADASDRIEQIILTGDVVVPKDEYNFFATSEADAAEVVRLAEIGDDMLVLEPSAGKGALALAAHRAAHDVMVDMFEMMPENNAALNALNIPLSGVAVPSDFLQEAPKPIYDRVVMNPPFAKQADIRHVNHALKFLKPGGKLVAIMAASVSFRENGLTTEFRDMVAARGGSIKPMAGGSFKHAGTMVNTVIVVIPN